MILNHQNEAFRNLIAVGSACFSIQRETLPISVRTNTLLIGPSGSGKTHLARAVAEELGAKFLSISASEWILLGCTARSGSATWPMIFEFLNSNYKTEGTVIFLDEIDKIGGGDRLGRDDSSWDNHLRTEVYNLLDLQIPVGLRDEAGNDLDSTIEKPQEVLSNRCFILAAGAFQHIWERRARPSLGFSENEGSNSKSVDLNHLVGTLPRELTNRFRSDLVILPQLREADYRNMLESVASEVPIYLRETFLRLGHQRIPEAVNCRQGCRFIEEIMLDTIIEEKKLLRIGGNPIQESEPSDQVDHIHMP